MIGPRYGRGELLVRDNRQRSIFQWAIEALGLEDCTPRVRMLRFVEEAVELAQVQGLKPAEVHRLVDYVFARPVGKLEQEVGGVSVTLHAFCESIGIRLVDCEQDEIHRINSKPIEHFRKRQREKMEAGLK